MKVSEDDARTLFLSLLGSIIVLVLVVLALGGCAVDLEQPVDVTPTTDVGQPLDAIRYRPPAWAAGESCYRVEDRQTHQQWWLVEMRDGGGKLQWVTLEREAM